MSGFKPRTVCMDFDGVLHWYRLGWHNGKIYDVPRPGAKEAVRALEAAGCRVVVCTAGREPVEVEHWLAQYEFPVLEVTNTKPPAVAYVDDRAVPFRGDWSAMLEQVWDIVENGSLVDR